MRKVVVFWISGAMVGAACVLNPQPIPPELEDRAADASTRDAASMSANVDGGSTVSDAAPYGGDASEDANYPPNDAATDAPDAD